MLNPQALQLRVGVDVGSQCHRVAVGLSDGSVLEEFDTLHTAAGFEDFFSRIEEHAKHHPYPIAVAMEGYNGHVRPLDSLVRARGWQLFNVNNLKLARWRCHVNRHLASLWAPTPEIMQRSSLAATVSSRRRGIGGVFGGRPDGVGR